MPVPPSNLSLKELTVDCGVDILSFGGTKNGLMMGECVIVFNKDLQPEARFIRKQSAQLASKMRYLSCQFTAYLTGDLWLKNASHANAMAAKLRAELEKLPEVTFTQKPRVTNYSLLCPARLSTGCWSLISFISGTKRRMKSAW